MGLATVVVTNCNSQVVAPQTQMKPGGMVDGQLGPTPPSGHRMLFGSLLQGETSWQYSHRSRVGSKTVPCKAHAYIHQLRFVIIILSDSNELFQFVANLRNICRIHWYTCKSSLNTGRSRGNFHLVYPYSRKP